MRNSATAELSRSPKRTGRRPGSNETRLAVLAAAQRQFAERGYDRSSLRSIAAEARVDQKLVGYFFGSKHALFVAATELPFAPDAAVTHVLTGDAARRGERLARLIVELLEDPEAGRKLIGLVRAAAAEPEAARMVGDLLGREIWGPAAGKLPIKQPVGAVNLIATQVLGLVMARYVIRIEPLASLSKEGVVELLSPALQRLPRGEVSRGTS